VRWAGRSYIGLAAFDHIQAAACNAKLNPHSPKPQNCAATLPF
jgi:hypothetical protein